MSGGSCHINVCVFSSVCKLGGNVFCLVALGLHWHHHHQRGFCASEIGMAIPSRQSVEKECF